MTSTKACGPQVIRTKARENALRHAHLRYWTNRQHAWPPTDAVIAQIRGAMDAHALPPDTRVFLASDTGDEERARLRGAFPPGRLVWVGVGGVRAAEGLSEAQLAVLDQVVCVCVCVCETRNPEA